MTLIRALWLYDEIFVGNIYCFVQYVLYFSIQDAVLISAAFQGKWEIPCLLRSVEYLDPTSFELRIRIRMDYNLTTMFLRHDLKEKNIEFAVYYLSKRFWPTWLISYSNLLYKMGQDFLYIQLCKCENRQYFLFSFIISSQSSPPA